MLGGRTIWLGRPWFFVALVVLALNDHVMKHAWPNWITGKLSDVAGVVVVATVLSVLAGATRGTLVAGLSFVLLKTVPGVAEAAAPLLGGVTLRDPSDLLALGVLPPLWLGLSRTRTDQASRDRRAWQAIGLVAALLFTTATSATPEDEVFAVQYADGGFQVELSTQHAMSLVYASQDGGRTWNEENSVVRVPRASDPQRECALSGICYRVERVNDGCRIYRGRSTAWQDEGLVPAGCPGWFSIAVDPTEDASAVTLAGPEGLAYREPNGTWVYVGILEQVRGPTSQQEFRTAVGGPWVTLALTLVLTFLIGFVLRTVAGRIVGVLTLWASVPLVLFKGSFGHWQDNFGWNLFLAGGAVLLATVLVVRSRRARASRALPGADDSGFDPPKTAR